MSRQRLQVNLTRSERALLEAKARNLGWSMSRTLVHCALTPTSAPTIAGTSLDEQIEELRTLRRQLSGVANNLNQIARHVNTTAELPANFDEVMQHLTHLYIEVNDLLLDVRR